MTRCERANCGGTLYRDQDGLAVCLLCNRSTEVALRHVQPAAERKFSSKAFARARRELARESLNPDF